MEVGARRGAHFQLVSHGIQRQSKSQDMKLEIENENDHEDRHENEATR
jgi:hypothetical protein